MENNTAIIPQTSEKKDDKKQETSAKQDINLCDIIDGKKVATTYQRSVAKKALEKHSFVIAQAIRELDSMKMERANISRSLTAAGNKTVIYQWVKNVLDKPLSK